MQFYFMYLFIFKFDLNVSLWNACKDNQGNTLQKWCFVLYCQYCESSAKHILNLHKNFVKIRNLKLDTYNLWVYISYFMNQSSNSMKVMYVILLMQTVTLRQDFINTLHLYEIAQDFLCKICAELYICKLHKDSVRKWQRWMWGSLRCVGVNEAGVKKTKTKNSMV